MFGARALTRIAAIIREDPQAAVRRDALRALEGQDNPAVLEVALCALADADEDVRIAAVVVLRPWVVREDGTRVMEGLVMVALDATQAPRVRAAALDALSQLPRDIVQPIADRAALDPHEPIVDEPGAVHEWLERHAGAPLSSLHALVARARDQERRASDAAERDAWRVARGAVHAALARRDSRVALYDLREAFDGARAPLPLDFLQAIGVIGDATCLEPIARAWAAAPASESWWRSRLAETARDLVARHHLTARNTVVKRVKSRWPGLL